MLAVMILVSAKDALRLSFLVVLAVFDVVEFDFAKGGPCQYGLMCGCNLVSSGVMIGHIGLNESN